MRYWLYVEPAGTSSEPIWMLYSEEAIIAEYWEHWERQGHAYNKAKGLDLFEGITAARCIDDWVTIHWAVPATPENLPNIISAPKPR